MYNRLFSCGIYQIVNTINGKIYIGSSRRIENRWLQHKMSLRKNKHHSCYLQRAWNKYGEQSFQFEIICKVSKEKLIQTEQIFLDALQSHKQEYGYNIAQFANASTKDPSPETRAKMSASARGNQSHKGHHHTEETKAKYRAMNKGQSPPNKGIPCSEEQKKHLSLINLGKNNPNYGTSWSKERREKMEAKKVETSRKKSIAMKGKNKRPMSEEQKEKLRQINLSKHHNEETKAKMSESRKTLQKKKLEKIAESSLIID